MNDVKLYFSVVSHQHDDIIFKVNTLKRLAHYDNIVVIFRDNLISLATKSYCYNLNIDYASNNQIKGFSENNNLNYLRAIQLGMQDNDRFILLNPDIDMSHHDIQQLISVLEQKKPMLAAPNLYLNNQKSLYDDNLRTYPTLLNFIKNYCFGNRKTVINKGEPDAIEQDFWVSGAFMIVAPVLYRELDGFDERYFMYCEDLDFCHRAKQLGIHVTFLANNIAIHFRRCDSRKFLSRAFFQHARSALRYVITSRSDQINKGNGLSRHKPTKENNAHS
jgi:N-acetylglucosaminyl-diphospho-decaprenol L-rhamnosyltransferase